MSCGTVPKTRPVGSLKISGEVTGDVQPVRGYVRLLDRDHEFVAEVPVDSDGRFTFFATSGQWVVRLIGPNGTKDVAVALADADAEPLLIPA